MYLSITDTDECVTLDRRKLCDLKRCCGCAGGLPSCAIRMVCFIGCVTLCTQLSTTYSTRILQECSSYFSFLTGGQSGVSKQERFENLTLPVTTAECVCLTHPELLCLPLLQLLLLNCSFITEILSCISFYFKILFLEMIFLCLLHCGYSQYMKQMYFTSILLNSPYFYKETRNLFNIPLSDVSGLSVMCSGKVWKIIVLITLRCNISHFSAHLTFPYFLSGGPGKHQMPKAKLHLLILSEVTKKLLPELSQNSNFTI